MDKILAYLNNYFYRFGEKGTYNISENKVQVKGKYIAGQYIRITGSYLNDTIAKVISVEGDIITLEKANNEEFEGVIFSLAIPPTLVDLFAKIEEFESKSTPSNLSSESFGNYSYSVATNKNGENMTWKDVFKNDLRPYRKIYDSIGKVKIIDN